ncbi:MAG: PQQ-like beta-propeller repeat protein, partial [Verrucomicrobiae bacterium]|nr:PQQ-like beta-propeller repeat protein [Verrucomicrobiae bacterium]
PNGTATSAAKTIPVRWTEKDIHWKTELPGSGHSSPVLWGNRLFITTGDEKDGGLRVLGLDAKTGAILWRRDYPISPFPKNKLNSFASATPAVDAERVYVPWSTPERLTLAAFDHDGKTVWERDLGPFISQHSSGASPILYEDRVVLPNYQDGVSFIVAVDAKTGQTRWQTPRKQMNESAAYGTPFVFQPAGGKPVLIFSSKTHGLSAINPDDGAVVWEFDQAYTYRAVSSPFTAAGLIFGTCGGGGVGRGLVAIRPGDPKSGRQPEVAYRIPKPAPYVPTSVVVGDYAYLLHDNGYMTCLHAPTGESRWYENLAAPGPNPPGSQAKAGLHFFSSPVCVDGKLYCASREGEMVVVEASPEKLKVLGRTPLGEGTQATPAVAGGRMYVRTEKHVFCVGGAKQP